MRWRHVGWAGLILALEVCWASAANNLLPFRRQEPKKHDLPLEALTDKERQLVKHVLDKPAFTAVGPSETFYCKPEHYRWFLDHPDRAVAAWRKLGAKCTTIIAKTDNQFVWSDDLGSQVTWEAIHKGADLRLWYAEGKVRAGPKMPLVPVKALVVMRHKEIKDADGVTLVQHQAELYVHTDSKTANMLARMLGPASHRLAEQGLGQLQLFFSGLSWYLDRHPEHADVLLRKSD